VTDPPAHRLSHEQLAALRFAAHRQLARWARRHELAPRQRTQRRALIQAVRVLEDRALAGGCELRATGEA
jgi:hypothetical protein